MCTVEWVGMNMCEERGCCNAVCLTSSGDLTFLNVNGVHPLLSLTLLPVKGESLLLEMSCSSSRPESALSAVLLRVFSLSLVCIFCWFLWITCKQPVLKASGECHLPTDLPRCVYVDVVAFSSIESIHYVCILNWSTSDRVWGCFCVVLVLFLVHLRTEQIWLLAVFFTKSLFAKLEDMKILKCIFPGSFNNSGLDLLSCR